MKYIHSPFAKTLALSLGLAVAGLSTHSSQATTQTWSGTNSGVWNTSTLNWDSGADAWTSNNDALFTGTPTNNVTTATGLTIGAITLDNTFTGSVTMSGANTVSGATTISSGTLNLNNATGLGTSAITVNSPGTLTINPGTGTSTVANNVSGAGLITAQDPGAVSTNTLSLSGIYSGFTGTLNILAGTSNNGKVSLTNATQANVPSSSATVQIQSGATLFLSNALNYGFSTQLYGTGNSESLGALRVENANLTGGVTLFANSNIGANSGTGTISGSIVESGGSFGFTKVGAGTIALSGSNSYSGTTTITAGTLSVGHNNALGTSSVAFNGGTLANTTGVTLANNLSTAVNGTITSSGGTMVLNGNITGANSLNLNPTNKITLAGTNAFGTTGAFAGLFVNAGAGGVDITGSTTLGNGGSTNQSGAISLTGATTVTIQSGGSLTINGSTNTAPGSIIGQNAAGTSTLLVNGGSFSMSGNTSLYLGNNVNTATGVLTVSSGTATITAGSATLQNALNFIALGRDNANGIINLDGGTLATGRQFVRDGSSGGTVGGGTANVNFNGGVLQALANQTSGNGWFETATTGNFQVVTTTVKAGGAKIDTNGFTTNINTVLAHDSGLGGTADGGLTKSGSGTLTLGAANTYTGATTVSSGTLAVLVSGSISGTVALGTSGGSTGTLDVTAKSSFSEANISGNGAINIGSGKTVTATGNVSPGFSAGTLNVTGNFTLASTAATALEIGGSSAGQFDLIATSGTFTYGGTLVVTSLGGYDLRQQGTYGLFTAGTFSNAADLASVIVNGVSLTDNSGVWSGTDLNGSSYTFTDATGVLTVIPEPRTWAMMLGGAGMLVAIQRMRRRNFKTHGNL